MAKRAIYKKLSMFKPYKERLIIDKASFVLMETSFTKKITVGELTIIFNEDGKQDGTLLQLISRVRDDAKNFTYEGSEEKESKINYFDLTEKPPQAIIAKIDIKSAYWETALKLGVISHETDEYLADKYNTVKERKLARLKALGSLATKRNFTIYKDGKQVGFSNEVQPTRGIYLHVCGVLDNLMKKLTFEIPSAFYYYVDCVFVAEKLQNEVIKAIVEAEYSNSIEYTEISTLNVGGVNYLISQKDNKQYVIPRAKSWLLNG